MSYPNPWLGMLNIIGTDEYGRHASEVIQKPGPPLYFWLGAEAYPSVPVFITSLTTIDGVREVEPGQMVQVTRLPGLGWRW